MRKILFLFLLVLLLIIGGCSQNSGSGNSSEETPSSNQGNEEVTSDFPTKPISLIVPFDVGSGTDVAARVVSEVASKHLPNNVRIVVENKAGGSGTIGLSYVANAKPDGYTIGLTPKAPLVIQPIIGDTNYTHEDFQPVMKLFSSFQALMVAVDSPWTTVDEWVKYVENNPGKFSYGHTGIGSAGHLAMEELKLGGLDIKEVPFQGGGPAISSLLGGHIDGAVAVPTNVDESLVRVLFNVSSDRNAFFPDVETLMENELEVSNDTYYGLIAPKGTSEIELNIIHDAFMKALEEPETYEKLKNAGLEITYESSDEFMERVINDTENDRKILGSLGLIKE